MAPKIIQIAAIKCTLGYVQMAKLLFGQYVFIDKAVNKINYSHCSTVQTTESSTVFAQFHFHKALNKPMSY